MSRAFVNEDGPGPDPSLRYRLPPRDDPGFDLAAARALLRAADEGESDAAEAATGYIFGERRLVPWVRQLLLEAEMSGNDRLAQLAERFLKRAGEVVE